MRTPTFDGRSLATLFLIGVALLGAWSAVHGTPPGELTFVPCLARELTGVPCPGCGMTRACVALARGQVGGAWALHPFAFLLVPLAACVALWPRGTRRAWARVPHAGRRAITGSALVLVLGVWASRCL